MYLLLCLLLSFFSPHYQVCRYGHATLEQLPESLRSCVLVAVTDLRKVKFMLISRLNERFTYQISQEFTEVLPALCSAMAIPLAQVTL
jgi:hypothetical protein